MKFLLIALANMMALAATACGGAIIEVYLRALVSVVTTASNPNDIGGISDSYLVRVKEGVEYFVYLSSPDGNISGIWNANADDFIIQAKPGTESRTVTHRFSEGGFQEVFLRSLDSDMPSPFTFKIWNP